MRRDLFSRLLTKRYQISLDLAGEVVEGVRETSDNLHRTVASWLRFVVNFKLSSVLAARLWRWSRRLCCWSAAGALSAIFSRPDPTIKNPTYLSRLSVAFWSTLVPSTSLGVFLGVDLLLLRLFRGAARRHRPYAGRALRRDRPGLLRASAGQGGSVAALAGVAADSRSTPARLRSCCGSCRRRRSSAASISCSRRLRNARRAAVAHRRRGIGRHRADRRSWSSLSGLVRPFADDDGNPRPGRRGSLFPLSARPRSRSSRRCSAMSGSPGSFPSRSCGPAPCWRRCISASCRRALSRRRAPSRAHGMGARFQRWFKLDEIGARPVQPRGQHPHQCRRRGDRAAADPVPVGLPAGRHQRLDLQVRDRHPDRLLHAVADRDPVGSSRLRRRLLHDPLVPGLAGRICDGARPRR